MAEIKTEAGNVEEALAQADYALKTVLLYRQFIIVLLKLMWLQLMILEVN